MSYINSFKDPLLTQKLLAKTYQLENRPHRLCHLLTSTLENRPHQLRTLNIMEVCGTHTMSIYKYGIDKLLPSYINLLSGPGCPVCVTDISYIDMAIELSRRPEVIIATFGDMIRVPGSHSSLSGARANGANIKLVYSPLDCITLAKIYPLQEIVFLAVGFETTAPIIALTLKAILEQSISNLSMLLSLKTMPSAMENLIFDRDINIDAFICPGHVAAIIGAKPFSTLAKKHRVPMVIAGFDCLDLAGAVYTLIDMVTSQNYSCQNLYKRVVKNQGNTRALALLREVFETDCSLWRGLGNIPNTGLSLKPSFNHLNALVKFNLTLPDVKIVPNCKCGDILKGIKKPLDCPLYKTVCTPAHPIGACMVSSEGTCMNFYKYNN